MRALVASVALLSCCLGASAQLREEVKEVRSLQIGEFLITLDSIDYAKDMKVHFTVHNMHRTLRKTVTTTGIEAAVAYDTLGNVYPKTSASLSNTFVEVDPFKSFPLTIGFRLPVGIADILHVEILNTSLAPKKSKYKFTVKLANVLPPIGSAPVKAEPKDDGSYLNLTALAKGDVGKVSGLITVKRVLDKDNMLVVLHEVTTRSTSPREVDKPAKPTKVTAPTKREGPQFVVRGFRTEDFADNAVVRFPGIYEVTGTHRIGSSTYFVIEPKKAEPKFP